jgi:hypothetical protein
MCYGTFRFPFMDSYRTLRAQIKMWMRVMYSIDHETVVSEDDWELVRCAVLGSRTPFANVALGGC